MTELSVDRADIRKQVESSIAEEFALSYSAFDPESLAWLALPPAWTHALAEACRFPTMDRPLRDLLMHAEKVGLCTQRAGNERTREASSFWATDSVRDAILKRLRTDSRFGPHRLRDTTGRIGTAIMHARDRVPVPDVIGRWAELAARTEGAESANEWLGRHVANLVNADATGAASAWLDTGASLARSIGGALEGTVRLGERWVELAYRRAQDERKLKDYKDRPELTKPLYRLLEPNPSAWALHYVGMGGVGKTMLMRDITARIGPERKVPVGRVDFDHLGANYPVRQPGQLLVELAAALRAFGSSSHDEKQLQYLRIANGELLESLAAEGEPANPLANIRRPQFGKVLSVFADFVRDLERPPGAPVLLILDTCEELARMTIADGVQPAVAATFEILTRVNQLVPDVRVVLAGRRLVAASGDGWSVSEDVKVELERRLPPRPFLALQEIRGFTREEAAAFLTQTKKVRVDEDQLKAILGRSRDTGTAASLTGRPPEQERFNPFDLSLYAEWLRDDPKVAADKITSGRTDPYVEMRIVDRLKHSPVRPLLPAVVLLQRFDQAMLRPAAPTLSDTEFDATFLELADQEWIEVQRAGDRAFCEVERNLQERLLAYFQSPPHDRLLADTAAALGPSLAEIVRRSSLGDLGVEHLNAALALLPLTEAAALWNDVMRRIADSAEWNWAHQVVGRLLGEGEQPDAGGTDGRLDAVTAGSAAGRPAEMLVSGAAIRRHRELRPALLATLNSATLHLGTATDLASTWRQVFEQAATYPDPQVARWLESRANAGIAADLLRGRRELPPEIVGLVHELATFEPVAVNDPDRWFSEQLAGSLCAAIAEDLGTVIRDYQFANVLDRFAGRLDSGSYPQELALFARVIAASTGDTIRSERELRSLVANLRNEASRQRWSDWPVPEPLGDHLRLRLQLHLWSERAEPERPSGNAGQTSRAMVRSWWFGSLPWLKSVESERFASALLESELAFRTGVDARSEDQAETDGWRPSLNEIRDADAAAYDGTRRRSHVHRAIEPLFVTIAEVYAAAGDPEAAFTVIRARRQAAASNRGDPTTVRDADLARLRVARRYRVAQPGIVDRIQSGDDLAMFSATLTVAALAGPDRVSSQPPPDVIAPDGPERARAWWSVQTALTKRERDDLVSAAGPIFRQPDTARDDTSTVALEQEEFGALARGELELRLRPPNSALPPTGALRLRVRHAALGVRGEGPLDALHLFDGIGRRTIAETAFADGELLALRLPRSGAQLLAYAANLYAECNDMVGAWMASIAAAIAWIHAGEAGRAREMLDTVTQPIHERIRKELSNESLPGWEELSGSPDQTSLNWIALTPLLVGKPPLESLWAGWLWRLAMCRWMTSYSDHREASVAVETFKQSGRWAPRFTAELEPIVSGDEGSVSPSAPALAKAPPPPSASTLRWPITLAATIGIATLGVLVWWMYNGAFSQMPTTTALPIPGNLGTISAVSDILTGIEWLDALSLPLVIVLLLAGAAGAIAAFSTSEARTVVLGLAALIGVIVAVYWTIGWFAAHVFRYPLTPGWQLASLAALGVLLFAAPVVGRGAVRLGNGLLTFGASYSVRVEEGSGHPAQGLGPGLDYRSSRVQFNATLDGRRLKLRWKPPFVRTLFTTAASEGDPPALNTDAITEALGEFHDELRSVRKGFIFGNVAVPIEIRGYQAQGMPWEAALRLSGLRDEKLDPLRFWRSGGAQDPWSMSGRYVDRWRDDRATVILASQAWLNVSEVWLSSSDRSTPRSAGPFSSLRIETIRSLRFGLLKPVERRILITDHLDELETQRPAILHVIGTPVVTTAGIRLRLSDEGQAGEETASRSDLDQQVGVPNLPVTDASLVIIQGPPAESRRRLDADREQSGNLRLFAAEVIEAGAAAVVVIPSLPPNLAAAVASDIASVSRKQRLSIRILLAAISRARARMARQGRYAPDSIEAAYDITLLGGRRQYSRYVS